MSVVKLTILGKPMGKQRPKFSNIGRFVKASERGDKGFGSSGKK